MMKYLLIPILFILTLLSCKKDDDPTEQPPITAENTYSCKVNGDIFIPEDYSSFPYSHDGYNVGFPLDSNNWESTFRNSDNNMTIYIYNVTGTGIYPVEEADGDRFFLYDEKTVVEYSMSSSLSSTHISIENSGEIEILEYEPGNKIIFQFDELILKGIDDPNDIIILSEGRGNFNLSTFNNN